MRAIAAGTSVNEPPIPGNHQCRDHQYDNNFFRVKGHRCTRMPNALAVSQQRPQCPIPNYSQARLKLD